MTMMMMTAMILATGPSTDCRIWLSGCSHGMLEPAANAGLTAETGGNHRVGRNKPSPKDEIKLMICPLLL